MTDQDSGSESWSAPAPAMMAGSWRGTTTARASTRFASSDERVEWRWRIVAAGGTAVLLPGVLTWVDVLHAYGVGSGSGPPVVILKGAIHHTPGLLLLGLLVADLAAVLAASRGPCRARAVPQHPRGNRGRDAGQGARTVAPRCVTSFARRGTLAKAHLGKKGAPRGLVDSGLLRGPTVGLRAATFV